MNMVCVVIGIAIGLPSQAAYSTPGFSRPNFRQASQLLVESAMLIQSPQITPGTSGGNPSMTKGKSGGYSSGSSQASDKKEAKAAAKGKDMKLTGWVREENGKRVFIDDTNKETLDIANPEAVKSHEGHHVKVTAKVDDANRSITIDRVTTTRASKQAEAKQKADKKD